MAETFYIPNANGWSDNGNQGDNAKLRLMVTRSYNAATNRSTLTITPQSYNTRYGVKCYLLRNASLTLNGNTVYSGGGTDQQSTTIYVQYAASSAWVSAVDQSTGKTVAWTATVDHAADGSATFAFALSFRFYSTTVYNTWYSVSGSASATEPRASSVSASNGTFGSAVAISVTRQSTAYTHTVTVACLGRTETVASLSTAASLSWTGAVATYAPLLTNAMSTTATITCQTFSGSTLIGTTTVTITMTLPAASVKPSTAISLADLTGYASTYGGYVATKSRLRVTLTNTLRYGATLASTAITANGQSFSASPAETSEIVAGNTAVTARITDSRGQSSDTASASITILAYSAPAITALSVRRCDQDGTANNAGAYCQVTYGVRVTALNNHNSRTLVLKYKKKSVSSWTSQTVTLSAYTETGTVIFAADTESTYDVRLELTDDFSTSAKDTDLSTAYTFLNFGTGALAGIGIGMVNTKQKTVELEASWNIERGSEALFPYPSGSGYCKLPGGTLILWGTWNSFSLSGNVLTATVQMSSTYSFVDTNYCVMITPARNCIAHLDEIAEGNANGNIDRTVNSFAVSGHGSNANITINWLAIGRWKA